MDGSTPRWLRRAAKAHGDAADAPSDLRRALADLGRVIAEPLAGEDGAGLAGVDARP